MSFEKYYNNLKLNLKLEALWSKPVFVGLILPALVMTLLNAIKPLRIDDTAYFLVAEQITNQFWNPYGFETFWGSHPTLANNILAPPVVPYWWSLIMRISDDPLIWKLWFFPFNFLLLYCTRYLVERFFKGVPQWHIWFLALSPAILPSINLMLDIPAQSLGLMALVLYFKSTDLGKDKSLLLISFYSAVFAALAFETKFSALIYPGLILLMSSLNKKPLQGVFIIIVSFMMVFLWETYTAFLYGKSHMLSSFANLTPPLSVKWNLRTDHLHHFILLSAPISFLVLSLFFRISLIGTLLSIGSLFFFVNLAIPEADALFSLFTGLRYHKYIFAASILILIWLLWKKTGTHKDQNREHKWIDLFLSKKKEIFLSLWFIAEALNVVFVSPFPCARRVIGLTIIYFICSSIMYVNFSSMKLLSFKSAPPFLYALIVGALFYLTDLQEAQDNVTMIEASKTVQKREMIHSSSSDTTTTWFLGHWGFQYYALKEGYKPLIPGTSRPKKGDLIIDPRSWVASQPVEIPDQKVKRILEFELQHKIPYSTHEYYCGQLPINRDWKPPKRLLIWKVTEDFPAQSP